MTCVACGHPEHTWIIPGCTAFADRVSAICGCTFSRERMLQGEADADAGRVKPLEDTMNYLRGLYR